jgi:hypothetical protein
MDQQEELLMVAAAEARGFAVDAAQATQVPATAMPAVAPIFQGLLDKSRATLVGMGPHDARSILLYSTADEKTRGQ